MRYREPAICIRTHDFSETSQIVHFFTRGQGLVRLIAKGTKRPKSKSGGMIDLLAEGDLVYSASGRDTLGTLMEFSETAVHTPLRRDVTRLHAALYLIELVGETLAESDVHPEVFDLLHHSLARLGQSGSPVTAVLAYFQWRLLQHVGLLGDLSLCSDCGQPLTPADAANRGGVYFSSQQGGLLCGSCEGAVAQKTRVDADTLAAIGVMYAVTAGQKLPMPEPQAAALNRLLAYHITHQLGKRLRMMRHVVE